MKEIENQNIIIKERIFQNNARILKRKRRINEIKK